jgi:hypothetical protein
MTVERDGLVYSTHVNGGRRDTRAAVESDSDEWSGWNAWADARIEAALAQRETIQIETIGEALGEVRAQLRTEIAKAVGAATKELRAEPDTLRSEISALRSLLVQEKRIDGVQCELSDRRTENLELNHAIKMLAEETAALRARFGLS